MRVAQYKILNNLFSKFTIPDYIYAFEKNKSIPRMAQIHTGKKVVISVDIKDFFHSIKQDMIHEMLVDHGMGDKAARTVSELCTYKAFVPQGALTSPKVANMITAMTFGPEIQQYCRNNGLVLSIYADDVTISSTNPALNVSEVLTFVTSTIRNHGFRINHEKTKVMWDTTRQYVCGVVVNQKTNLMKRERYKLRAIVHNIQKNGVENEAKKSGEEPGHFASHIMGRLNWFKQLNLPLGDKYMKQLQDYLASRPSVITGPSTPTTVTVIPASAAIGATANPTLVETPW